MQTCNVTHADRKNLNAADSNQSASRLNVAPFYALEVVVKPMRGSRSLPYLRSSYQTLSLKEIFGVNRIDRAGPAINFPNGGLCMRS
jgi:hypothetical protein